MINMSLSDGTTRSLQIISGASNCTFTAPNTFTYRLPQTGFQSGKDECALKSLTVYYSWPNITAALGNNSFSYTWPGAGTFSVVMADGIWSFADIQAYLQVVMVQNGHYLVDAAGHQVFYLSLVANPVTYSVSLTATPLPSSLPAGWSNPAGVNLVTTASKCPQLVVNTTGFSVLTGFSQASYPSAPSTSLYQVNSGIPQITGVTSINVLSSIVDNSGFSISPNILTSFAVPNGQTPGSLIEIMPPNLDWVPIRKHYNFGPQEITLSLIDQTGRPLNIRDPSGFVAILNMRQRANMSLPYSRA